MDMYAYDTWLFAITLVECCAIVLGNGFLVITFVRHRTLLNAMNCYICSMCFSGLITGVIVPLGFGNYVGPYTVNGPLLATCTSQRVKTSIFFATACNSILCMLAIAVERWRTLANNQHRQQQRRPGVNLTCKLVIAFVWAVSVGYAAMLITIQHQDMVPVQYDGSSTNSCHSSSAINQTDCGEFTVCFAVDPITVRLARNINLVALVVIFIVPLCIISVIYTVLVTRLLRNAQQSEKRASACVHRAKLRAMQAMILVVVIFAFCWLPSHVFFIWMLSTGRNRVENAVDVHRVPLGLRVTSDLVLHLVITHHWIQVFIYPRYSRQLANAIKETVNHAVSMVLADSCYRRVCATTKNTTTGSISASV